MIKRIHFFSGITISLFVGLHLFNHMVSIFGPEMHLKTMDNLRLIYRNIFVETILLLAVFIQIISGIKLFFSRRQLVRNFYEKLQIWSGLYLAFFLVIHVSAVLVGRYILQLDTNFYFGAVGLNTFPFNLFFIPYYGLAILSFFGHIASIHFQKMKKDILSLSITLQSKLILMFGFVVVLLIFYGMTNGFAGVQIPRAYDVMIGK